jgi:putative phosphoesterase
MRVALIGDVHANLPALEAVLDHVRAQEIRKIWNVGDFVGYGAFPNEVIELLRKVEAISIVGNYDLKVVHFPEKENKWRKSKQTDKFTAFQWAYQELTPENRRYLAKLPEEVRMKGGGRRVLLTHGSPVSNEEHLTPETTDERLAFLVREARTDVLICGHSHQPFARQVGDAWVINTGSVGRPGDGDPRACYATLVMNKKGITVQHYRVEYDVQRTANAVRQRGLPEAFAQMFLQGYDLETIKGETKSGDDFDFAQGEEVS